MISVAIFINGRQILRIDAVNQRKRRGKRTIYTTSGGGTLLHDRERGALPLAIQMLKSLSVEGQPPVQEER